MFALFLEHLMSMAISTWASLNFRSLWKLTTSYPLLNHLLTHRDKFLLSPCHLKSWRTSGKRSCHIHLETLGVQSTGSSFPMCFLVAWGKKICEAWFHLSLYLSSCLLTCVSHNFNWFFWYKDKNVLQLPWCFFRAL